MRTINALLIIAALLTTAACDDDVTPAVDAAPTLDHAGTDTSAIDQGIGDAAATDQQPGQDISATADKGPGHDKGAKDAAPDCSSMAAQAQGSCDMLLGWAWDGKACASLTGCSCTGADCGKLFAGSAACYKVYSACVPCTAMDAKGDGACMVVLGWVYNGTACVSISGCTCKGTDCGWIYPGQGVCSNATAHCP